MARAGGWQGGGWQGGGGGGVPTFAMRADKPVRRISHVPLNSNAAYPDFSQAILGSGSLGAKLFLPEFFTLPKTQNTDPYPFAWQNVALPGPGPNHPK